MNHKTRKIRTAMAAALGAATLTFAASPVPAGTATDTTTVTATVEPLCSMFAGDLTFGTYTGNADVAAVVIIGIDCPVSSVLTDDGGANPALGRRNMAGPGPGDLLEYELHTVPTLNNEVLVGHSHPRFADNGPLLLDAVIRAGQTVTLGAYSDTLTWTLTW